MSVCPVIASSRVHPSVDFSAVCFFCCHSLVTWARFLLSESMLGRRRCRSCQSVSSCLLQLFPRGGTVCLWTSLGRDSEWRMRWWCLLAVHHCSCTVLNTCHINPTLNASCKFSDGHHQLPFWFSLLKTKDIAN